MSAIGEFIPLVGNTTQLAALPTTLIPVNAVIKFVDSMTSAEVNYQLRSGGGGSVVPLDYNITSNNKSWFQV